MKTLRCKGMSNEKQETIADIVAEVRRVAHNVAVADANTLNGWRPASFLSMLADLIEAAHERELADEKRISDAVIQSLRDQKLEMAGEIAVKDSEVSTLRALVGEMADALDTTIHYRDFICDCGEPSLHNCSVRSRVCFAKNRLLVMKARNVVKAEGGER